MSTKGPRVLVIGRSGQLASELEALLAQRHWPAVVAGRPDLDLADASTIDRIFAAAKPDLVINAAAYTAVDKAESEPQQCFAINRDGPGHLATLAAKAAVPFIHVSTDMVFSDTRERAHREDDAVAPISVYGQAKYEGEAAVAAAGGAHLIARVSWVFGPSGDNFVRKLLQWAETRDTLKIVSDQRGRPTFAPALATALLDLGQRMLSGDAAARPGGLVHLAGASVMTRDAQAEMVMAASAARGGPTAAIEPVATAAFPTPARRPLNAVLDVALAWERYGIGFDPFEQDLEMMLDCVLGPRSR